MEIYISDWIHKFQNKTGLDAKANSELYKSKRVCSAFFSLNIVIVYIVTRGKNFHCGKKISFIIMCKEIVGPRAVNKKKKKKI
jgi:hypothetical protein